VQGELPLAAAASPQRRAAVRRTLENVAVCNAVQRVATQCSALQRSTAFCDLWTSHTRPTAVLTPSASRATAAGMRAPAVLGGCGRAECTRVARILLRAALLLCIAVRSSLCAASHRSPKRRALPKDVLVSGWMLHALGCCMLHLTSCGAPTSPRRCSAVSEACSAAAQAAHTPQQPYAQTCAHTRVRARTHTLTHIRTHARTHAQTCTHALTHARTHRRADMRRLPRARAGGDPLHESTTARRER
jgi:hypothetical protein